MIPVDVVETEAEFQGWVLDAARMHGWRTAHFRAARTGSGGWATPVAGDGAGFPDLVLAHPHQGVLFIELKTRRGRLTPAQQVWGDTLTRAGAAWYVWRPQDRDTVLRVLAGGSP